MSDTELDHSLEEMRLQLQKAHIVRDSVTTALAADAALLSYKLGNSVSRTLPELAAAILNHWDLAFKDWQQGHLWFWLENEWRDQNPLRFIQNLRDASAISPEAQLLRFVHRCDANLPLTWRKRAIDLETVLAAASSTQEADQDWLFSLYDANVLELVKTDKGRRLTRLFEHVDQAWSSLTDFWQTVGESAQQWRQTSRLDGYSGQNLTKLQDRLKTSWQFPLQPQKHRLFSDLVRTLCDTQYVEKMRQDLLAGTTEVAGYCPWFAQIDHPARLTVPQLVAAKHLLFEARADAKNARRIDEEFRQAQSNLFRDLQQEFRRQTLTVRRIAEFFPRTMEGVSDLQHALESLIEVCQRIKITEFIDNSQAAWAEQIAHLYISMTKTRADIVFLTAKERSTRMGTLIRIGKIILIGIGLCLPIMIADSAPPQNDWVFFIFAILVVLAIIASLIAGYRKLARIAYIKSIKKIYKTISSQMVILSRSLE